MEVVREKIKNCKQQLTLLNEELKRLKVKKRAEELLTRFNSGDKKTYVYKSYHPLVNYLESINHPNVSIIKNEDLCYSYGMWKLNAHDEEDAQWEVDTNDCNYCHNDEDKRHGFHNNNEKLDSKCYPMVRCFSLLDNEPEATWQGNHCFYGHADINNLIMIRSSDIS